MDNLENIDGMKTITAATRIDLDTPIVNLKDGAVINSKGTSTINVTTVNATNVNVTGGLQAGAVALTATTGADTTGIVPAGTSFVSVTSSANTKGIKLPAPVLGNIIYVKEVGANGYYVIPEATTQFINGTEVTGAKKLACAANSGVAVFICVVGGTAGKWIQYYIDDDGTIDTGGTPS